MKRARIELMVGDCVEMLNEIERETIDSCVTDPPYHLVSIVKRFGQPNSAPVKVKRIAGRTGSPFARSARGFMGKQWDGGDVSFQPETWWKVFRVMKPGAYLVAFGGTRTYHRLACAIEDAGFEVRDMISWLHGQGFPKSHDQGDGFGTALKPACEPIVLARKPLSEKTVELNIYRWGTGGLNIDDCRLAHSGASPTALRRESACRNDWDATAGGIKSKLSDAAGRMQRRGNPETFKRERPAEQRGRWPANVAHDGSQEVVDGFPDSESGVAVTRNGGGRIIGGNGIFGGSRPHDGVPDSGYSDSGSAARFFYTAKAGKAERDGSKHPTVKPLDLMQWLVRLVTPRCGVVLDPFAGTGTTGEAAHLEGMSAILIEREAEYQRDIRKRLKKLGL